MRISDGSSDVCSSDLDVSVPLVKAPSNILFWRMSRAACEAAGKESEQHRVELRGIFGPGEVAGTLHADELAADLARQLLHHRRRCRGQVMLSGDADHRQIGRAHV